LGTPAGDKNWVRCIDGEKLKIIISRQLGTPLLNKTLDTRKARKPFQISAE